MNSKATVYGRTDPFCVYCEQAKNLLSMKNIPFEFVDVGKDITKEELLEMGMNEGLVRISVGIEDVNDLISDFNQALEVF